MKSGENRSILCPIDFSADSEQALVYAAYLARQLHARVSVLHAERFEPPPLFVHDQVDSVAKELRRMKSDAAQRLREYAAPYCQGLEAQYRVVEDGPVEAILASVGVADLIVMGTAGRTGVKRILMGSVAEAVTRQSPVPVLAVRGTDWGAGPRVERILVPVNFTDGAAGALNAAAELAQALGATLLVTHIVERPDEAESSVRSRLCEWVPTQTRGACQYDVVVRHGDPAEQIIRLATELKADLVAVAAVHRPFLETTIIGSTSERVVRHAPCPVLTVPVHA